MASGPVLAGERPERGSTPPPGDEEELVHAGETVAGKYRIDRRIARGGMGSVWAGWDTELDRPVAVKFMDPSIAASKILRERFQREARAAAGLRTPFVVQIFEHGLHGKVPFIAMELLEGEDLHDRLVRERRLSPQAMARILNQVARALRRAHDKGIVHRDLKPRNIFLARDEDEETVKILDFGIAKNLGQEADGDTTKTGQVLGSLNYMSPEQARGFKEIDHRADLWSVAVILFRALTGRTLFSGQSSGDVIVKICTDPIPRVTDVAPDLPEPFNAFFARALDRDPDKRFPTAAELAVAFMELVRVARPVPGAPVAGPAGSPSVAPSGEWTPRSDIGNPFSDSKSYPSVDFGPSGVSGATPPPALSDPGLGSSPSAVSVASGAQAPWTGAHTAASSLFDDTEAAGAALASTTRQRRKGAWVAVAIGLVASGGLAAWLLGRSAEVDETASVPGASEAAAPAASASSQDGARVGTVDPEPTARLTESGEPSAGLTETASAPSSTRTARTTKPGSTATRKATSAPATATATATSKPKERWGY